MLRLSGNFFGTIFVPSLKMKKVLSIKSAKPLLILSGLLLSNVFLLGLVKKESENYSNLTQAQDMREMEYVRDGMELISWSYALLKYFKNNSPNT